MSKSQDTDLVGGGGGGGGYRLNFPQASEGAEKERSTGSTTMLQTKLNNAIFSSIQSPSLCKDVGDSGNYGVSVSVLVLPLQTVTESVDTFPRDRTQPRV